MKILRIRSEVKELSEVKEVKERRTPPPSLVETVAPVLYFLYLLNLHYFPVF
jgi:hypothetical protein